MKLEDLIKSALEEDIGSSDVTTDAVVEPSQQGNAEIRSKQDLVVAGLEPVHLVFQTVDPTLRWSPKTKDGEVVAAGTVVAALSGSVQSLLKGERVALNFLQHLCGVATLTHQFVEKIKGTKSRGTQSRILDTRKTIPGLRTLEKFAVRMGGGNNHRVGLFDRYLIKNNHIKVAGSLQKAVEKVLSKKRKGMLVEVEVRSLEELQQVLEFSVDIILCDNFSTADLQKAVQITKGRTRLEASGGITLNNVAEVAKTGVDFISVGAITHSAPAADLHMVLL